MLLVVGCGADRVDIASSRATAPPSPAATAPVGPSPARTAGTAASQRRPFVPTELRLPSGTTSPVEPAGVDGNGVLQVPHDPSLLGWWTGGALAGDPFGSVVLAGHVDTRRYGLGVLAELLDVSRGDRIDLIAGDLVGSYLVSDVVQVPKARLAEGTDTFAQDTAHRLVLVTCTGAFDRATGRYADNLVVTADPIEAADDGG